MLFLEAFPLLFQLVDLLVHLVVFVGFFLLFPEVFEGVGVLEVGETRLGVVFRVVPVGMLCNSNAVPLRDNVTCGLSLTGESKVD